MQSHAAMPIACHRNGTLYRIYFGTRDGDNKTRIAFIDININRPQEVCCISDACALDLGEEGHFDDNAVYPGSIISVGDRLWMYYSGRSNGEDGLFYMAIGLAESTDGGRTFGRKLKAPVMQRSEHDPWMVSTPCVLVEGGLWRMWYMSGLRWRNSAAGPLSYYHIKYAESDDGIHWRRDGRVCIDFAGSERNIAAPTILKEDGKYKMWYSYAGDRQYRIGYADSDDGYAWIRKDGAAGIRPSPEGWDSISQSYPCIFTHGERKYLLYSGNDCGRDGMGIAIWSD